MLRTKLIWISDNTRQSEFRGPGDTITVTRVRDSYETVKEKGQVCHKVTKFKHQAVSTRCGRHRGRWPLPQWERAKPVTGGLLQGQVRVLCKASS